MKCIADTYQEKLPPLYQILLRLIIRPQCYRSDDVITVETTLWAIKVLLLSVIALQIQFLKDQDGTLSLFKIWLRNCIQMFNKTSLFTCIQPNFVLQCRY